MSRISPHTTRKLAFTKDGVAYRESRKQAAASSLAHVWTGDGNRCAADGYDGPICARCGLPDISSTKAECRAKTMLCPHGDPLRTCADCVREHQEATR